MSEDVRTPETGVPATPSDSPSSRMRSRLGRFGARSGAAFPAIEPVLQAARTNHPKADLAVVEQAYVVAEKAHRGQLRKSGDPYITHPVAVATILAELGMTPSTLAAALLHDTVEDTDYSLDQLRREFGPEIAMLVDGVTKLDKVTYGDAAQAETVRKMVVAMSRDIRVLVIKLADRLHNARTWKFVAAASAEKKARETLEIYAPLAHRLGMNTIKWELEDLSFATLYPKVYDEIVHLVAERAPAREEYLATVREQVGRGPAQGEDPGDGHRPAEALLLDLPEDDRARPRLRGHLRPRRRARPGRLGAGLLRGARRAARAVEPGAGPVQGLHRDAQVQPLPVAAHHGDRARRQAASRSRSARTTCTGVRSTASPRTGSTRRAPRTAPGGHGHGRQRHAVAAPARRLAEGDRRPERVPRLAAVRDRRLRGLRLHARRATSSPCPSGSTPVDFAYAVHTEVGHRTMGARVNGRLVPLDSTLENGDVVDVFTSKSETAGPSRDWLGFVKSPRARNKIRQWFSKERREEAIEHGKDAIAKAMRKQNLPIQRLLSHESLVALANEMRYADVSALYAAIGEGQVSAATVVQRLVQSMGGEPAAEEDLAEVARPGQTQRRVRTGDPGVVVKGVDDIWVKLAKCCTPVPGDEIVGLRDPRRGRERAPQRLHQRRRACARSPSAWSTSSGATTAASLFLVQIQVEALDRSRLLSDVTRVLSDSHVNILSASVSTSRDRVALSRFVFEMAEPSHLASVLAAVRKVEGVFDVYRITGAKAAEEPAIRA